MGDKTDKPRKKYSAVVNVRGLQSLHLNATLQKNYTLGRGGWGWLRGRGGGGYRTASVPLVDVSRAFLLTPRKVQLSGISCRCNPNLKLRRGCHWKRFGFLCLIHSVWQTNSTSFSGRCHWTARHVLPLWPISIVSFLCVSAWAEAAGLNSADVDHISGFKEIQDEKNQQNKKLHICFKYISDNHLQVYNISAHCTATQSVNLKYMYIF